MTTKALQPITQDQSVEKLISQAIDKSVPVETMEKLLAMRRELKAEWAKEQFDQAMASFQSECPVIEKDKHVDYTSPSGSRVKYSYAPLDSIVRQVKEIIAKNGLSYGFNTSTNGSLKVVCTVKHVAGHSESSDCEIQIDTASKMNKSQQSGSTMTYAKRYAFCNAFGILTGDEDNDAQTEAPKTHEEKQEVVSGIEMITAKQIVAIATLAGKKGYTLEQIKQFNKVASLNDLTKEKASGIIDALDKKPNVSKEKQPSMPVDEYDAAISEAYGGAV